MLFCGSHQDTSVLTILAIFDQPGLQVLHDGEYKSIQTGEAGFVINVGKILVAMCGNGIKVWQKNFQEIEIWI